MMMYNLHDGSTLMMVAPLATIRQVLRLHHPDAEERILRETSVPGGVMLLVGRQTGLRRAQTMTILRPTPTSTRDFTWVRETRHLVAEASTLGPGFEPSRVFDDACDVGLTLVSHHTGDELVVALHATHRDREGDVTHWEFRPVRGQKHFNGIEAVVVFND